MRAILTSHYLKPQHFDKYKELIGKEVASKGLFITAAAVPYGIDPKPDWLIESLGDMQKLVKEFDETTLEDSDFLPENLESYDFIFVSGGNVFYLAYRLAETGLDKKIYEYVNNDKGLYSGSSAGAIILMKNIKKFAPIDKPEQAPTYCPGLGLIDFAVIPHADNKKYAEEMKKIASEYKKEREVVLLNDDQILLINGNLSELL